MSTPESTGYEMIRRVKRQLGGRISDWLALDRKNDSFYVGSPLDWEKAQWFAAMWQRLGCGKDYHLRRIHYRLAVAGDSKKHDGTTPYENTERDWEHLGEVSKKARAVRLVEASDFDDHRNPDPYLAEWNGSEEAEPAISIPYGAAAFQLPQIDSDIGWNLNLSLPAPTVAGYEPDDYRDRAYILEVWIEKTPMDDILEPLCAELGINVIPAAGVQSISSAISLLERCWKFNEPARVLYFSDFDPAGNVMPVAVSRHLEYFRPHYAPDAEIKLIPVALTAEQAQGLPRIPIKDTDLRRSSFEMLYGEGAVELDALEALRPGEFERLVRQAVTSIALSGGGAVKRLMTHTNGSRVGGLKRRGRLRRSWPGSERAADEIAERYQVELAALNARLQDELKPLRDRLEPVEQSVAALYRNFEVAVPERPAPDPGFLHD